MAKRIIKALIGTWKPRTPTHSLPSYDEPTAETNPKVSREEEADRALKRTAFTAGTPFFLIAFFLFTITSVPAIQLIAEWRTRTAGAGLPMLDIFKAIPSPAQIAAVRSLRDAWQLLPHAEQLKTAERTLESDSVVSQWLLPGVQSVLVGKLGAGNEQVYLGRNGWLFYRPDVDYVTGPGFLDPAQLKHRAHAARVEPDPVRAIVQFRDQLAARGIELVVVPAPTKASIDGEKLSARARQTEALQNASFADFQQRMAAAGVRIFDSAPMIMQRKTSAPNEPLYLRTDTHWQPATMELVAQKLAASLDLPRTATRAPQVSPEKTTGRGDVAQMLKLPADQQIYPPETIAIRQVTAGNGLWRPSADADVLLLGDSFANIFSLEALGWGESAGFAEHLSVALGGRPLDCILRNSDGAFATREMLANELARGRDRLAGKKLVIWEFAARELAFGNWKLLDLKLGQPQAARFFSPPSGQEIEVTGIIEAVGSVPRPGTVPYRDHIMAVQLGQLHIAGGQESDGLQAIVYLWSMRENVWTRAARLHPGERITVRIRPWADVVPRYEQTNRSDLDDPALQLEEPVWGELIQ